jgi:hypothetical protein
MSEYGEKLELRAGGSSTALASRSTTRSRGTMLWFNGAKDLGSIRTDDGEQIDVPGTAFLPGEKPVGRCAGKTVEFESLDGAVSRVAFVPEPIPRRARRRHR